MSDEKRMASAAKAAVYYRNYRRARDRALIKLSHLHPEHYKELLEKEKVSDEQKGKTWIDINGLTNLSSGIHTRANGTPPFGDPADAGEDEGDDGGEA